MFDFMTPLHSAPLHSIPKIGGVELKNRKPEWGGWKWSGDQSGVAAEWSANGVEQRFQNSTEVEWSGIGCRSGTAIYQHGVEYMELG